jgi:hypothetical protein
MKVNDQKVIPWNPFAIDEEQTVELSEHQFELEGASGVAAVRLRRTVLPPRDRFSSPDAFERMSGPLKWNRQQGFYVYRENRMIQSGGWCGLRTPDEHTKLARLALFFPSQLDELFQVNVAKMRVVIPTQLRKQLEEPVHELCQRADAAYRAESPLHALERPKDVAIQRAGVTPRSVALALSVAASEVGEFKAFERIMGRVRRTDPSLAREMGWG